MIILVMCVFMFVVWCSGIIGVIVEFVYCIDGWVVLFD